MMDGFKRICKALFDIIKKHKKIVIAISTVVLLLLCVWFFLRENYILDPGIDYLHKYAKPIFYGMDFEQLYVNIESGKSKFDINEDVTLSCKIGVLNSELLRLSRFDVLVESDYFDAELSCPAVLELGSGKAYTRDDFVMHCTHSNVTKKQLPFAFNITLSKKENFPNASSGFVNIRIRGRSSDDFLLDPTDSKSLGIWRHTTIYYYASGNRLYISDISIEDAMNRGKIVS